jgi:hypothetical protein
VEGADFDQAPPGLRREKIDQQFAEADKVYNLSRS